MNLSVGVQVLWYSHRRFGTGLLFVTYKRLWKTINLKSFHKVSGNYFKNKIGGKCEQCNSWCIRFGFQTRLKSWLQGEGPRIKSKRQWKWEDEIVAQGRNQYKWTFLLWFWSSITSLRQRLYNWKNNENFNFLYNTYELKLEYIWDAKAILKKMHGVWENVHSWRRMRC